MKKMTLLILVGIVLAVGLLISQTAPPPAQTAAGPAPQAKSAARPPAAPRGRTVTLGDLTAFELKDNVFQVAAGPDLIRIIF
jgi:hypothetical protein